MPSHTTPSSVLWLYYNANGAPWDYPQWRQITHSPDGLFPENGTLPKGLKADDIPHILSFFDQYEKIRGEEERRKFVSMGRQDSGGNLRGRLAWRDFVLDVWAKGKIHDKISKALSDAECHPVILLSRDPELKNVPFSTEFIPLAVDGVGIALFGHEALDKSGRLPFHLRRGVHQLIQRTWINLCRQFARSKKRLSVLEAIACKAFEDLGRAEKITKQKISTVIRAVSKWSALAKLFENEKTMALIDDMDDDLKRLMSGLGAPIKPVNERSKGLCKVSSEKLRSLASEEDVEDIIALYSEHFSSRIDDEGPILEPLPIGIPFGEQVGGQDAGMEVEATMPPENLAANLGFRDGNPLLFNRYRHKGGLTAWNPKAPQPFDMSPANASQMEPFKLRWHQVAAIHSMARNNFSKEPRKDHCPGALVTDEVGLGKTYQAAGMIAFLTDAVTRQAGGYPQAPIISNKPYLGSLRAIPDLPHLILVPGTLVLQWIHELEMALKPHSFDIFVYGSGLNTHEAFFAPSGPFHSSRFTANRIIVASHSALGQDFGRLYTNIRPGSLPWELPKTKAEYDENLPKTLFGQRYLTVTLDEAHNFRTIGTKHYSALAILACAAFRLVQTATPLLTSNADTAAMGRLLGIKHFMSPEAAVEDKNDAAELRRAKKDLPEEFDVEADDGQENPVKLCQIIISRRQQEHFGGLIIRRTPSSKDWRGAPLVELPGYESILGLVELTDRETRIISNLLQEVKESVSEANNNPRTLVSSKAFYIDSRIAVGYAHEGSGSIPTFNTLDEWEKVKSTKMDTIARICKHALSSDSAPPVEFQDGRPIFPPVPSLKPGEVPSTKIAIYQEFSSLAKVFENVLRLYGISCVCINGTMPLSKRDQKVKAFKEDPNIRVIILSSIGSAGLNLANANIMIFLDQPWSAQDERQIIGRVHRQPQNKTVYVYHILAKDTADIILSSQARGKRDMMEAFLSKQRGQELYQLLSGQSLASEGDAKDDDEYVELDEHLKKKPEVLEPKPKQPRRKRKVEEKSASEPDLEQQKEYPDEMTTSVAESISEKKTRAPSKKSKKILAGETTSTPNLDQPKEGADEDMADAAGPISEKKKSAPPKKSKKMAAGEPSSAGTPSNAVKANPVERGSARPAVLNTSASTGGQGSSASAPVSGNNRISSKPKPTSIHSTSRKPPAAPAGLSTSEATGGQDSSTSAPLSGKKSLGLSRPTPTPIRATAPMPPPVTAPSRPLKAQQADSTAVTPQQPGGNRRLNKKHAPQQQTVTGGTTDEEDAPEPPYGAPDGFNATRSNISDASMAEAGLEYNSSCSSMNQSRPPSESMSLVSGDESLRPLSRSDISMTGSILSRRSEGSDHDMDDILPGLDQDGPKERSGRIQNPNRSDEDYSIGVTDNWSSASSNVYHRKSVPTGGELSASKALSGRRAASANPPNHIQDHKRMEKNRSAAIPEPTDDSVGSGSKAYQGKSAQVAGPPAKNATGKGVAPSGNGRNTTAAAGGKYSNSVTNEQAQQERQHGSSTSFLLPQQNPAGTGSSSNPMNEQPHPDQRASASGSSSVSGGRQQVGAVRQLLIPSHRKPTQIPLRDVSPPPAASQMKRNPFARMHKK